MTEKEKYLYSIKIAESEEARFLTLENKAKFLFSFATLMLGGVLFKFEIIKHFIEDIERFNSKLFSALILLLIVFFALSLLYSIFSIFKSIRLQGFKPMFPDRMLDAFYSPKSTFFESNKETDFFNGIGEFLLSATEQNKILLKNKAKWMSKAWVSLLISVSTLVFIFILLVTIKFIL